MGKLKMLWLCCMGCLYFSCAVKPLELQKTGPVTISAVNIHTGKKDIFKYGEAILHIYGYQAAYDSLAQLSAEYDTPQSSAQDKSLYYQAMMTFASFCGNHPASLQYEAKAFPSGKRADNNPFNPPPRVADAKEYILNTYKNDPVLLLNEAHSRGQHRAFMRRMLPELYQAGFRYLAVETLDYKDSLLEKRGYPTQKSGYYLREPAFGQLIRDAQNIGFSLVAYEDTTTFYRENVTYMQKQNMREKIQADNIAKIFEKDKTAKIIVWAGHGHIHKQSDTEWIKMGEHLCKMLRRDIPAIECTVMKEGYDKKGENGIYQYVMDSIHRQSPFVLLQADTPWVTPKLKNKVTLNVFFPRTNYDLSYPDWMREDDHTFYQIDLKNTHDLQHKLFQVYKASEWQASKTEAIPILQFPIANPSSSLRLYLKKGKYYAFVFDTYQKILYQKRITVR
jgi:hypothetical protein